MSTLTTLRISCHRHHLLLMRIGWTAVFLLTASMFAASLPHAVSDVRYYEWQVLAARPAAAAIFPTYADFVTYLLILRMLAVAVFWGTAVTIAWRKPNDWLVLYVSATLLMMSYLFAFQSDVDKWRFPNGLLIIFPAVEWAAPLLFATCFFLLFYLFPDGRFTPRWIGLFGIGGASAALIFFAGLEDVLGIPEDMSWLLFIITLLSIIFIGLISQALKWRQATLAQKQQTRLVLLALTAFIFLPLAETLFSIWFVDAAWGHFISLHLFLVSATLIPLAIGISALRYRLWQMDRLLNRTIVYGGLTAVIILLYVLVVGGLGVLFRSGGSVPLAVLATGLIAVIFNPLRQRLQTAVNRLMYGQRDDPLTVMTALGRQLEQTAVPDETLPNLVQTIAQSLKLPYVALTVREDDIFSITAVYPKKSDFAGPTSAYPLVYLSEKVGELLVAPRSENEPFTAAEAQLLRQVARQAGTAVHAVQLTRQLQHSRERLVAAREEERRRLRRDLHDGLGPQLAALTVKVDAARNLLRTEPDKSDHLLAEIKMESQRAIQEIRRVVEGLRPSELDQLGLGSALREFAAQNENGRTQITLHTPETMPPLPAAVEVAAYRIITEAVANCLRHARAPTCVIRISINEDMILEIQDDGRGLPLDLQPGIGLSSMQVRAEELGGTLRINSKPDSGTQLFVSLPITNRQLPATHSQ